MLTLGICTNNNLSPKNETHKILEDFQIVKDRQILARKSGLVLINKEKITCYPVEFADWANKGVKIKDKSEKIDKYLDFPRKLKKR